MPIERLVFQGLRNLQALDVSPGPRINLISGANGSGKTSLLEGIHILGMGRSFRARRLPQVITHDADAVTLHGRLSTDPPTTIGIRRQRDHSDLLMKVSGEKVERIADLVETLPMQLINPDAFRLLEGPPAGRREFLDWGVFHVKHDFIGAWQRFRRALKHRNALLRHGRMDDASLNVWEHELAQWGNRLDELRAEWVEAFLPVFEETLEGLISMPGLRLRYSRGWDRQRELADVLHQARDTDRQMGFTQQGPQRADLGIRLNKRPAVEVLSRGQQKLVVSALKLAQGRLLERTTGRTCLYLIDDLPAELDRTHRAVFCQWLERMQCQAFITSVDHEVLANLWQDTTPVAMFHVKHDAEGAGQLQAIDRQTS
ncbi:DNA replication/repair protein RecF [Halomonas huangheensis]|uniref:DNA replication and repair protein RecF n=1 Tax=Halomonas huangheensis TaxID=1178482 RepID=W1N5Z0_9GAMM|nr:DNA replication/repair protein RecF [Halomonas huangheensis]ALM50862.1 recombinase RecF [Halomonas huangheensis]ERL50997.1 recombinase RecF [Halomonas huangheensis]